MSDKHDMSASEDQASKLPYTKPSVKRIDLALAETLSSGCKVAGTQECQPGGDGEFGGTTSELGS